jgi:hypothetical protein
LPAADEVAVAGEPLPTYDHAPHESPPVVPPACHLNYGYLHLDDGDFDLAEGQAAAAYRLADKTFQQISEEFAELVVPRVWEREGRNISRVATRLSISPKKVRRILTHVGRRKLHKT